MTLIVQKFGGTSLADPERIRNAARIAAEARARGHGVVVVVSAMSGETNRLVALGRELNAGRERDNRREMDALVTTGEQVSAALLALALQGRGVPARSLNASQVILRTDGRFGGARIRSVDCASVLETTSAGGVAVVTGFQGVDGEGNLVTLGRGGSDTTAVALAAALGAERCEIYTDVDGIYTADPRICPDARRLTRISAEEMLELASLGAKVLQIRCVELAMKHGVRIMVKSSMGEEGGTEVTPDASELEGAVVTGVALDEAQAQISVVALENRPDVLARLFGPLAEDDICVDLITQNLAPDGTMTVSFTLDAARRDDGVRSIESVARELGASELTVDDDVAKVSVVGIGMRTNAGVAQKVFALLSDGRVPIHLALSTEIKVSCVVPSRFGAEAVRLLHEGFGLVPRPAAASRE